ncbi:MAG: SIS domain-containing protein [Bacteroidia bacterium]|nr:SIS domain-containing protein [Bacteroidia bacterium]
MIPVENQSFLAQYTQAYQAAVEGTLVTRAEAAIPMHQVLEEVRAVFRQLHDAGRKLMIVGNGGSAGIAGHMAIDFWKNGEVRALTFHDAPLLTCIANDFSYADVYAVPVRQFADAGDLLMAISSSGSSANILRAVQAARDTGCTVMTFSGFAPENTLRTLGDLNIYVPSYSYGIVECVHQAIIHTFLDARIQLDLHRDVLYRNQPLEQA